MPITNIKEIEYQEKIISLIFDKNEDIWAMNFLEEERKKKSNGDGFAEYLETFLNIFANDSYSLYKIINYIYFFDKIGFEFCIKPSDHPRGKPNENFKNCTSLLEYIIFSQLRHNFDWNCWRNTEVTDDGYYQKFITDGGGCLQPEILLADLSFDEMDVLYRYKEGESYFKNNTMREYNRVLHTSNLQYWYIEPKIRQELVKERAVFVISSKFFELMKNSELINKMFNFGGLKLIKKDGQSFGYVSLVNTKLFKKMMETYNLNKSASFIYKIYKEVKEYTRGESLTSHDKKEALLRDRFYTLLNKKLKESKD